MSYAGETLNKKCARDLFWTMMMDLAPEFFSDGRIAVLASAECGDVAWLSSLGGDLSRIVAIDIDPAAIAACACRFPEVTRHLGDYTEAAELYRGQVSVAFLDLCSNVSLGLGTRLARFAKRAFAGRQRSLLAVGFARGREGFSGKSVMRRGARLLDTYGLASAQRIGRTWGGVAPKEIDTDRANGVAAALDAALAGQGGYALLKATVSYQGRRTPMQYALFEIGRRSDVDWLRASVTYPCGCGDYEVLSQKCDGVTLGGLVVGLADAIGPGPAAARLNAPPSSVSAWRAHESRGSYRAIAPIQCSPMYIGPLWPTFSPSYWPEESTLRRVCLGAIATKSGVSIDVVRRLSEAAAERCPPGRERLFWSAISRMSEADASPFWLVAGIAMGRMFSATKDDAQQLKYAEDFRRESEWLMTYDATRGIGLLQRERAEVLKGRLAS